MHKHRVVRITAVAGALLSIVAGLSAAAELDLSPLPDERWNSANAGHLASRAGFGASLAEREALGRLTPGQAVQRFVQGLDINPLPPFQPSDIFDPGLDPFPASRPALTAQAKAQGHGLGVTVKPAGNRPLQPVVDRFFYWLRASYLETDRVAYWWADRMLTTAHPLQEKAALFWHGHFATNEDKVRDYRKMLQQLQVLQQHGLGDFRTLLIEVAQSPAMLAFLDAGVNTKDSPNENFAREILELFTMGVGHYSERDVQEAARAFTGWHYNGLEFVVNVEHQDAGRKRFLGTEGDFDGIAIIDIILQQPQTARFLAAKLYRYFVNEDLAAENEAQLGRVLQSVNYNIGEYLSVLFRSNDFYQPHNVGSRIKGPVELMVSTYRYLGLQSVPGVPDFNQQSQALGQRLLHPPTVAGWSHGRSWITPSLLFERANFVLDVFFPDVGFVAPDRFPIYTPEIVNVQARLRQGMSVSEATRPTGVAGGEDKMAASNLLADRDEDFNTRLGSLRGWQMALERVKPIERAPARVDLTQMVLAAQCTTPLHVINFFERLFFAVALPPEVKVQLAKQLRTGLGTSDLLLAQTYMETALRTVLHEMLSLPQYQLD
ncbi:MAG: DUF1800 family protein [bacterium]